MKLSDFINTEHEEKIMKKSNDIKFRTVAVPNDVYKLIREIAQHQERTIARQLGVIIKKAYAELKNAVED